MGRPATMFYWKGRGFATDAGGKRTVLAKGRKTRANRELAVQRLAELFENRSRPQKIRHAATISDIVAAFLDDCRARVASGELKPNTVELFYEPYGKILQNECGDWTNENLNVAQLRRYRERLENSGLKPNTIKNRLGVLRTVLRWAKNHGLVARSCDGIVPCLPRRRRERIPTQDEAQQLLKAARPDVRDVLMMLLNLPVRPGDIYSMRRSWVRLDEGLIHLADSKTGPRIVMAVDPVIPVLRRRLAATSDDADFVFTTVRGRRWSIGYFAEMVRKARRAAGLGPHVTAYGLRHRWTTNAFLNGLPLHAVRALRGDKSVQTTVIYEHLAEHEGYLKNAARQAIGLDSEAAPDSSPSHPGES